MIIKELEDLFKKIDNSNSLVILYLNRKYKYYKRLKSIIRDPRVFVFWVNEDNCDVLQLVRIPQIRIYINGSEKVSLVGSDVFDWEKALNFVVNH